MGPYLTSELALFWQVLSQFPDNCLLVGDGAYGSYVGISMVRKRGSHVLTPFHGSRRGGRVKRYTRGGEVYLWFRPGKGRVVWSELLQQSPVQMQMRVITQIVERRGYRNWTLRLSQHLWIELSIPQVYWWSCILKGGMPRSILER